MAPLLVDVAQPPLAAPPSRYRPTWNAATIVFPKAKLSGSTSVACSPELVPVYGSRLIRTGAATAAGASAAIADAAATALFKSVFGGMRTAAERSWGDRTLTCLPRRLSSRD